MDSLSNNNNEKRIDTYVRLFTWLERFELVEFYLVPMLFALGLIGNLIGSSCIFSNRTVRRKTPLFILAACGLSDQALLGSQLQVWLGKFISAKKFLITNSLCKIYFMLARLSVIVSASLVFVLLFSRVVSLWSGTYRLSVYSNLGNKVFLLLFPLGITLLLF